MNVIDEVAATLDGYQMTDEEGEIEEDETSSDDSANQEENTLENTSTAEKSEEEDEEDTQSSEDDSESGDDPEHGVDEKGRRYVPEKRFKEVYRKAKEAERRAKALEAERLLNQPQAKKSKDVTIPEVDRTELLEVEILKGKLPQFDPDSDDYSPELDELGGEIFRANPGITRLESARRAIDMSKKLASTTAQIKAEARAIKSDQSDQGITNRAATTGRDANDMPGEDASDAELERWLKANGQW